MKDVVENKSAFDEKIKNMPEGLKKLVNEIKLLFEMCADYYHGEYREVPWTTIAMLVVAIVYFISPIDVIPDVIPVVGYVDDAFVISLAFKAMEADLRAYCQFKGYDESSYFA